MPLGFKVHRKTLANALPAIVVEMPHAHTATACWGVRVGSRDEAPRLAGISHFVEHLKFRGTERSPTEADVHQRLESMGAIANAFTSRETTLFFIEVRPPRLPAAIELLGEFAGPSTFNGLEVERRVILSELSHSQDEDGVVFDLHDVAMMGLWPNQPVGQPVIGSTHSVKATTSEDLRAHVLRHYTAENSVVVVAGAVDPPDAFDQLERHFARLARGPVPRRRPLPPVAPGKLLTLRAGGDRTEVMIAFALPTANVPDLLALELLCGVLGPPGFGRLHRSLRTKAGLAYMCAGAFGTLSDAALLTIAVNVGVGKLPQAMGEILGHFVELRDRGPTQAELATAKEVLSTRAASSNHAPTQLVGRFAESALEGVAVPPEQLPDLSAQVTCADVQRLARAVFAPGVGHLIARGAPAPGEYEGAWGKWEKALGK